MRIILASASPRRSELLSQIRGVEFEVLPSNADENIGGITSPKLLAMLLARIKAEAVFDICNKDTGRKAESNDLERSVVLGADTIVVEGGRVLGKPKTRAEAIAMLMSLSGKRHSVITGICFYGKNKVICSFEESIVEFLPFKEEEILSFVEAGKSYDKSGGYAIQDEDIKQVTKSINGSITNIVGLPIELTEKILGEHF